MHLTLGDEEALTEETVTETLRRVTDKIRQEGDKKYRAERDAHKRTQDNLSEEREDKRRRKKRIYYRCDKQAKILAWLASSTIVVLLLLGLVGGAVLGPRNLILASVLILGAVVYGIMTLGNLLSGITVKTLYRRIQGRCLAWLLKHQNARTGLDFPEAQ